MHKPTTKQGENIMHNNNDKNNCTCTNLNVAVPEQNINTGHLEIEVGELCWNGITLKGLHAVAHADFTDERVRVEADMAMKLVNQLLATFGDSLVDLLKAESEVTRSRKAFYEAQAKAEESRASKYDAEAEAVATKKSDKTK